MFRRWPIGTLYVVVFGVLLASVVPHQVEAAPFEPGAATPETVVLLSGSKLTERRLAAFVEIQPGRFLAYSALRRACLKPAVRPDSLLLFFPDSQRCEQLTKADELGLPLLLHAVTGSRPPPDLKMRLLNQPFVTLAAALQAAPLRAPECTCPGNTAPDGMVGCQVQTRIAGARIAPIEYFASDADGDSLSGEFTHQRGIDPIQPGLPAPLASTCTANPGTLHCTIVGNAPDQAGDLQLMLAVSDGAAALSLVALVEVTADGSGLIFIDSFETPVCP